MNPPPSLRSAITISLVPEARGGPFVFWDGLEKGLAEAAELGFDAVEIFPPSPEALEIENLTRSLAQHGLQVAALGTGGGWVLQQWTLVHADAAIREKARDFIRRMIRVAGRFSAPAIIGSMQGRWTADVSREQALTWLGEALAELGAEAAAEKTVLLYEPLNRYETNLFHRVSDTAEWLRTLPAKNVRILADLFHMNIEESDLPSALRAGGELIGHVHFADSNRRAFGFGHTEPGPIIAALRENGYSGYLSAEILPWPDSRSAAQRTIETFRRVVT